jgi:hypothetical protein
MYILKTYILYILKIYIHIYLKYICIYMYVYIYIYIYITSGCNGKGSLQAYLRCVGCKP